MSSHLTGHVGRGSPLDPRTQLLLVASTGAVMSLPTPEPFLPVVAALMVVLLCAERAWRRLAGFIGAATVLAVVAYVLPLAIFHPATALAGYTTAYLLRFVMVAGIASHLIATTSPALLTASLRAARIPRAIVVPTAVTLPFLPVVATETRAVWEAMRMRGIAGVGDLVRHPIRAIEWLTVPAIASTLRVGEDLAAGALLRGLGGRHRPTSIQPVGFTTTDLLVPVAAIAAGVTSWWYTR